MKGWIHKILIHQVIPKRDEGNPDKSKCLYESFLSSDQEDKMYKLNDDGLIWWVDEDDNDYSEMDEFVNIGFTAGMEKT